MRRKIRSSPPTSSCVHRRKARHNFRPALSWLEDRTLLATMIWANSTGGDWDTASDWVNSANASDHHVPTASDDAQINLSGITVTHSSSTPDSVNSVTVASGTAAGLSNGTLSIAAASTISGNLIMSGGTLTGAGTVTVDGLLTWSGGTMSGSGTTIAQGGMALGGTAANTHFTELLSARTLENFGTATLTSYYTYPIYDGLWFDTGATLVNEPRASFDITGNAQIVANGGSPGGGTVLNEGTFAKTGGSGLSVVGVNYTGGTVTFNESGNGTVAAQSGTLQLNDGATLGGTGLLTATSGGTLAFSGGDVQRPSRPALALPGPVPIRLRWRHGQRRWVVQRYGHDVGRRRHRQSHGAGGDAGPGADDQQRHAECQWWGTNHSRGSDADRRQPHRQRHLDSDRRHHLEQRYDERQRCDHRGGRGWPSRAGTYAGPAGNIHYTEYLSARTLENLGTATLDSPYSYPIYDGLWLDSGSTLINEPGASFDLTSNAQIVANGGSPGGGTVLNEGTFAKTGGSGLSVVGVNYTGGTVTFNESGNGTVAAQSGTLQLNDGATLGGTGLLTATSGGTLAFSGGTFNIPSGSGIAGSGSISFAGGTVNDAGSYNVTGTTTVTGGTANLTAPVTTPGQTLTISSGTFNLSGGAPTAVGALTLTGGNLTGSDTLTVTGATTWSNGTMSGSGVTIAEGGMAMGGTYAGPAGNIHYTEYLSARTLENLGTATLDSPYSYPIYDGLWLDSGSTLINEPGASFDLTSNAQIVANGGSPGGGTVLNEGTFAKTGGSGLSVVGVNYTGGTVTFNESGNGTVAQTQSGTLQLNDGAHSGQDRIADGD